MKNIVLTFVLGVILSCVGFSQQKNSFKYQAVVRDNLGNVIENTPVALRISILKSSDTGENVYTEEHSETTNKFGLIVLSIGGGTSISGNFNTIDWAIDNYFLKIEIDVTSGTDYETIGTSPLLSVPYALHAETVSNSDDADADPVNEIQSLNLADNTLSITQSNSVDLSVLQDGVEDADADPVNEIQNLKLEDNILTITQNSSATMIDLSGYLDNTDIQLTEDQVDSYISNNGYQLSADDGDIDASNELQNLSIIGDTILLSKNGGNITLPAKGWGNPVVDEALFAVVNTTGDTVFAVYSGGVRINVDASPLKAAKGGFAVGGFSSGKGSLTNDYLSITPIAFAFMLMILQLKRQKVVLQ